MAGVVIVRPVELGETVTGSGSFNAGTVIATVADLATMLVKAGVNEVDIGKVHVGQPVRVTLDAYPRTLFPGTIERIAPAARLDNQVKVFDLEIGLEHLGVELRTGMTANVEVRGESRSGVLIVPVEAVFVRGDEEVVYVKRATPLPAKAPAEAAGVAAAAVPSDNSEVLPADWRDDPRQKWRRWFEERRVVTGIASTTDVEVTEGLAVGDEVALADPTRPPEEEQ
jgi:multidrug efflux pump subunit AcrA (membrane-fusion protein)